jgi:hypothetical protein
LFHEALAEHDISVDFQIDHQKGKNLIGDLEFDIKFPRSYVGKIQGLDRIKQHQYCFIGKITASRKSLLAKYREHDNIIQDSSYGRNKKTKFQFEPGYYQTISNSTYCLCPIHEGSWYVHDHAWTYRFIESAFCGTMPVAMRDTPIGKDFYQDIFFYWDDEVPSTPSDNYNYLVEINLQKALHRWTLQPSEISLIKQHI